VASLYGTEASDRIAITSDGSGEEAGAINVAVVPGGALASYAVYGGAGDDSVSGYLHGKLLGEAGDDTLTSTASFGHFLLGGEGDDQLYGGSGSDYLDGGAGVDTLDGGLAQDKYMVGKQDASEAGVDTVSAKDGIRDLISCDDKVGSVESYDPPEFNAAGLPTFFGDWIEDCAYGDAP
jgi:Ca2+-binding RTX toxin-like protein